MKFLRISAGYTLLDHKQNDILEELKIGFIIKFVENYQTNWKHVMGMKNNRMPKQVMAYRARGIEVETTTEEKL
jgi:hypothetical protein